MSHRACVFVVFLAAVARGLAGQDPGPTTPRKDNKSQEVVTMANMRALVPTLLTAGSDDFFLKWRDEIGLLPGQVQELLALRLAFLEDAAQAAERVRQAELAFYEEISQDQVSARQLEAQSQSLTARQGRLVALKLRYLLLAINVLNHDQHQALIVLLKFPPAPVQKGKSEGPRGLLHPNPTPRVVPHLIQYSEHPRDTRFKAQADRCTRQGAISVTALLSYEPAREAASRLIRAADQLRNLAESGLSSNSEGARKLVAQLQPELWLLEDTSRTLLPLAVRNHDQSSVLLGEQLRLEPMAQVLTNVSQELRQESPSVPVVTRQAEQLKELAKRWRKGLDRVGEALCLSSAFRFPPSEVQWDDRNARLWQRGAQTWRPF